MRKLRYVDGIARKARDQDPVVAAGNTDITVEDMNQTVAQFYRRITRQNGAAVNVALESDLADLFLAPGRRRKNVRPAADVLEPHRSALTDKITYWTGVKRPVVRALVERIIRTCRDLNLQAEVGKEGSYLVELTAYGTTMAMNYLTRGRFVLS